MGFENLAYVHSRWHAQRIENDVDGLAVLIVGHVLHWHDCRNHSLVTVPAGQFVPGLHAALDRQVNLDDLEDARRQIIALGKLLALVLKSARRVPRAFLPVVPGRVRAAG